MSKKTGLHNRSIKARGLMHNRSIKARGLMHNLRAQELPMSTIILVILTIIAIAVIIIFVFSSTTSGTDQTNQQAGIGESAADAAACDLWASGLSSNFDCSQTECSVTALCKACNKGMEIFTCKKPAGFTGCIDCP